MSIYKNFIPYSQPITSNFFSLAIQKQSTKVHITMESLTSLVNTQEVPAVSRLIKRHIPEVLLSQCFNDNNFPFSKELKKTEIAHLFEHILLAVLCIRQSEKGNTQVVYDGVTSWNWIKEKKGVFHITINLVGEDDGIFQDALRESIEILEQIYLSHHASLQKKQVVN